MTNLTNNEIVLLQAFLAACADCNGATTLDEVKGDNMTWADADELAARTGLSVASVKGVLGSLTQKGLVGSDDKPNGQRGVDSYLTAEGIEAAFGVETVEAAPADKLADALVKAAEAEQLAQDMGQPFPGIICSTIRFHAARWEGSRKDFIAAGAAAGFNKLTLATQWQKGRK